MTTAWDNIETVVSNAANAIKTGVTNAFNAMLNGIKNICGNIYGAVKGGFDTAISFVKNLASEAFQWGAEYGTGRRQFGRGYRDPGLYRRRHDR